MATSRELLTMLARRLTTLFQSTGLVFSSRNGYGNTGCGGVNAILSQVMYTHKQTTPLHFLGTQVGKLGTVRPLSRTLPNQQNSFTGNCHSASHLYWFAQVSRVWYPESPLSDSGTAVLGFGELGHSAQFQSTSPLPKFGKLMGMEMCREVPLSTH